MSVLEQLGIDRLPVSERLELARDILQSVMVEQTGVVLTERRRRELDGRLKHAAENPGDEVPWEQVRAEALTRYGQ